MYAVAIEIGLDSLRGAFGVHEDHGPRRLDTLQYTDEQRDLFIVGHVVEHLTHVGYRHLLRIGVDNGR